MKVFQAVARALAAEGIDTVFALPGYSCLDVMAELAEVHGARVITARHEQAVVAMADGYSRVSGRVGLAMVTEGPGLTNTATALTTASRHRSPVVLFAGEAPRANRHDVQRMDQDRFVSAIGVASFPLRTSATALEDVWLALRHVRLGNGPAVINAPADIQSQEYESSAAYRATSSDVIGLQRVLPDRATIERACDVIARSHRPLILAGRGAYESGAREAILELADRIGAPLTTTVQAHGMFAGLPQDLGIVGGFAFEETSSVVAGADCVLAVGASLNAWTTKHGSAFGDAHIIHVDLAPSRVGAVTAADTQVIGDAAATIGAFNQCLQHRGVTRDRSQWLSSAEQAGAAGRGRQYQMADEPGRIDPRHLMAELDAVFPAERCVVLDGGHFLIFPMLGLTVPDPRGFIFSQDFGAVGLGLPLGIGAALGAPDRRCLTIVGDGGLMFGVQELETAVRYQIPITVVVMNDNVLQAEALYLLAKDRRIEPVSFAGCDFASIARSFGAVGLTITRAEQIEEIKAASLKTQGPVVADVKINPNVIHNWLNAFGFAVASTA